MPPPPPAECGSPSSASASARGTRKAKADGNQRIVKADARIAPSKKPDKPVPDQAPNSKAEQPAKAAGSTNRAPAPGRRRLVRAKSAATPRRVSSGGLDAGEERGDQKPGLSEGLENSFSHKIPQATSTELPPPPLPPPLEEPPAEETCVKCDKCDGPHETQKCPHFRKARSKHKDAWGEYGRSKSCPAGLLESEDEAPPVLRNATVVKQPGDGSCLFHSLSYGLQDNSTAQELRKEISGYLAKHPDLKISDTSLKDWIKYDTGGGLKYYITRMSRSRSSSRSWGGGIEIAAFSKMKNVNVHVYERCTEGFKRISAFESADALKTVSVLYQGRMHYDALVC